jgi:ketosteroid isomerase-like protein
MNSKHMAVNVARQAKRLSRLLFLLALGLALATTATAQKKKKKEKQEEAAAQQVAASVISSLPDEQKIDRTISEMLGAWQVGDTTAMHKYIADDVSVVAGTWTPPAIGWTNYLAAYQVQRARMQQVRLDRSNTLVRIAPTGTVAWACYQWEFSGIVDGGPSAAIGQTTLILEKRADAWIIVHNHTSLVQASQPINPANVAPQPAAPAAAKP